MSMRLKRFGDWIQYDTENGRTFYYNDRDGTFQWDNPVHCNNSSSDSNSSRGGDDKMKGNKNRSDNNTSIEKKVDKTKIDSCVHTYGSSSNSSQPIVGSDWKPYMDPASGSVFWYNHRTLLSQWELPTVLEQQQQQKARSSSRHGGDKNDFLFHPTSSNDYQEDVAEQIHDHVNDLGI